jgi:hypothetical protein
MLDINGQELRDGAAALLLCEILSIGVDQVLLRVMNSDLQIAVGAKHDEVLGGLVADSELTAFDVSDAQLRRDLALDDQADGVKRGVME